MIWQWKWKRKSLSHVWLFLTPWTMQSMEFSRPGYWRGQSFPSVYLHNPGIKSRSPALEVDSLPAEPQGKSKNTGVGSLSLLQLIFPTQEWNQGLLHRRWILRKSKYLIDNGSINSFKAYIRKIFFLSNCKTVIIDIIIKNYKTVICF